MWTYWIKKEIARQFARSQEKRKKRFVDYRKTEILTLLIERESLDSILPIVKDLSKESIKRWLCWEMGMPLMYLLILKWIF